MGLPLTRNRLVLHCCYKNQQGRENDTADRVAFTHLRLSSHLGSFLSSEYPGYLALDCDWILLLLSFAPTVRVCSHTYLRFVVFGSVANLSGAMVFASTSQASQPHRAYLTERECFH